jgi:IS605 OrfB family transposase
VAAGGTLTDVAAGLEGPRCSLRPLLREAAPLSEVQESVAASQRHEKQSCRYPQGVRLAGAGRDGQIYLPKIGWLRCVVHCKIDGKVKQVTVSKTAAGRYFVSLQVEVKHEIPAPAGGVIGIDLGLTHFATLSNGEKIAPPRYLRKSEQRLKRLQRQVSRRVKGSKGREKARLELARQHEKVSNRRSDFLHKLSRRLVDENQLLAVEDLNVKGMLHNHRLSKSIADASWSEFLRQLRYKGEWYGCQVVSINRFYASSKRCHHVATLTMRSNYRSASGRVRTAARGATVTSMPRSILYSQLRREPSKVTRGERGKLGFQPIVCSLKL